MKLIAILFLLNCFSTTEAQQQFIVQGKIDFEMKKNQHRQLEDDGDGEWIQQLKKNMPKFVTENYILLFNSEKTVYKLGVENTDNKYLWGGKPSETDNVVQQLSNNKIAIQRDVYEQTFLIQDSIRNLEWRITDETREIAGFECKKAVTKICDSVYVVAFYTDLIPVSAGPESFGGLPGMILGLAVPRLSTTWYATKVELLEPTTQQLNPIQKGKKNRLDWFRKFYEKSFERMGQIWGFTNVATVVVITSYINGNIATKNW
jgi:GLPGLI family protein